MQPSAPVKAGTWLRPPAAPEKIEDVGVRRGFLEELLLKVLYLSGPLTLPELGDLVRLTPQVVEELFRRIRAEQLCQVTGMVGNARRVAISSAGRSRALELLSHNQYTGPAPVSLESYVKQVRMQSLRDVSVRPAMMERAMAHLVLDDRTVSQLGTALNSGGSIFLYGPTGAGKTTIAEALPRVLAEDMVWIPHAVEIDGQVIVVFDPLIHKVVQSSHEAGNDARWVLCQRPVVVVGGELTIEMLDLQFNPVTKFYAAPGQMKANNGVLIIDDFGRQRVRPEDLLNRWVVPLDRKLDFLTLAGGKKIEIPFESFVVFATNMDPSQLVDTAFLRRIQTKVRIDNSSDEQFKKIFQQVCKGSGLQYDAGLVDGLIDTLKNKMREPLRNCYPRDLVDKICSAARYQGQKPELTEDSLMRAVESYFVIEPQAN